MHFAFESAQAGTSEANSVLSPFVACVSCVLRFSFAAAFSLPVARRSTLRRRLLTQPFGGGLSDALHRKSTDRSMPTSALPEFITN